jgi:predicted nucleotidyltransferase
MSIDKEDVVARLRGLLEPVAQVEEAYLFGSVARGEGRPTSDVDVAVYLVDSIPREERSLFTASLVADLMTALGTNAVDVVVLNGAPPLIYQRILSDGVRLVARDLRATTTREARAISRYCDWLPQLEKIESAHRRRIADGAFGR